MEKTEEDQKIIDEITSNLIDTARDLYFTDNNHRLAVYLSCVNTLASIALQNKDPLHVAELINKDIEYVLTEHIAQGKNGD